MRKAGALGALAAAAVCGACGGTNVDTPFNHAPRAKMEETREGLPYGAVRLIAVSEDPDGDVLRHEWTLLAVPEGSRLAGLHAEGDVFEFAMDVPGTYSVELDAYDGEFVGPRQEWVVLP